MTSADIRVEYPAHGFGDVPAWVDEATRWIAYETFATGFPGDLYNMDWIIDIPDEKLNNHIICNGSISIIDVEKNDLLTKFPINILNSSIEKNRGLDK